ncbi:MAG TPA: hypothetical protein VLD37_04225 [Candidatus Bilamarchaeum sp.]|nr:hypothetical protein [Candidatus Bilamarchaeum sp.]
MQRKFLAALSVLICAAFAITLESPATANVQSGDIIDLGTIGPGQTVDILIDPKVTSGGLHGEGGFYDAAVAEQLPRGWAATDSKLYQRPLQVTITANPDAPEGNYTMLVKVLDENDGEKLGNITLTVKVRVVWDVMDFDVDPPYKTVGPGQPARFALTISNKGSASDAFEISSTGSKMWEFRKHVLVPAKTTKTIYYEVVGEEEETIKTNLKVVSLASSNIAEEKNVTLTIKSDLIGDYKATNNGVIIFPIFEAPIYGLAGLLSNLFG